MRFVICDDDQMVAEVLDAALTAEGHELVGVAGTTQAAVELLEHSRPELAVIEPSVGCNASFDAIDAALSVGTKVVLFGHEELLVHGRYRPAPRMVLKPNISRLEEVIDGLTKTYPEIERRQSPTRRFASAGPSDAAAFYAAVNEAAAGDAFVSVSPTFDDADDWVARVVVALRETDLVLRSSSAVLVFMPGSGEAGVHALHERLIADAGKSNDGLMQAVVLEADESPTDAFARLKDSTQ
jgi:DNA-binding NarL/FixJ family response regulator